jgi:hypothetical protein
MMAELPASTMTHSQEPLPTMVRWRTGEQAFSSDDLTHAMMVAPVGPDDQYMVYVNGTQKEVLKMILTMIDAARSYGLIGTLQFCLKHGIGIHQVEKVVAELWAGGAPEMPRSGPVPEEPE